MRNVVRASLVLIPVALFAAFRPPSQPNPFADNNGRIPPTNQYNGPLFKLSHGYPAGIIPLRAPPPWRRAIGNGKITTQNAAAYTAALKAYVAADMRALLLGRNGQWDPGAHGWYNEPWLGASIDSTYGGREAIHGMYVGNSDSPANQFAGTGLKADFTSYVLTYYDRTAANTLFKVWGRRALTPTITTPAAGIADNGIVVKLAFSTANAGMWPVMVGALQWPVYDSVNATTGNHPPRVDTVSLFQLDIVVKDVQSAPKTQWVFTTLVYDKDAPGNDIWDKMVPLGAQWGDDPGINSVIQPAPPLQETWINPAAPKYSTMTLGWGGRLSGPNDGAVNDVAFVTPTGYDSVPNVPISSCLSCHSTAEWSRQSFLLPTTATGDSAVSPDSTSSYMVIPALGSPAFMRWFLNRPGSVPMDKGSISTDFDMVMSFKSLRYWSLATRPAVAMAVERKNLRRQPINEYTGKPLRRR